MAKRENSIRFQRKVPGGKIRPPSGMIRAGMTRLGMSQLGPLMVGLMRVGMNRNGRMSLNMIDLLAKIQVSKRIMLEV